MKQQKKISVDDKINLQTSACDKIANTEFTFPLTSQINRTRILSKWITEFPAATITIGYSRQRSKS